MKPLISFFIVALAIKYQIEATGKKIRIYIFKIFIGCFYSFFGELIKLDIHDIFYLINYENMISSCSKWSKKIKNSLIQNNKDFPFFFIKQDN